MKTTLRFAVLVAVFTLTLWSAQLQSAEASYPACWDLQYESCSPSQGYTYCWSLVAELAWCTCVDNRWSCSSGGPA